MMQIYSIFLLTYAFVQLMVLLVFSSPLCCGQVGGSTIALEMDFVATNAWVDIVRKGHPIVKDGAAHVLQSHYFCSVILMLLPMKHFSCLI